MAANNESASAAESSSRTSQGIHQNPVSDIVNDFDLGFVSLAAEFAVIEARENGRDVVTLYVGDQRKPYEADEEMLCRYSPFFRACFSHFSEAKTKEVHLKDERPECVEIMLDWVAQFYGICDSALLGTYIAIEIEKEHIMHECLHWPDHGYLYDNGLGDSRLANYIMKFRVWQSRYYVSGRVIKGGVYNEFESVKSDIFAHPMAAQKFQELSSRYTGDPWYAPNWVIYWGFNI